MDAPINADSFRRHTRPEQVRVLQIIFAALAIGVVTFSIIVAAGIFVVPPGDPIPENVTIVRWMTIGVLVVTIASSFISSRIPGWMLSRERLGRSAAAMKDDASEVEWADLIHTHIRVAEIVRMAILEASAIFGLVICVLALVFGVLPNISGYWINLLPAVLFLAVIGMTFPTSDRLSRLFEEYVGPNMNQ